MKGSAKGAAPAALTAWWAANASNPPPAWNALQNPEKAEIFEALLAEQHHVCVYCGRQITAEFRSAHIEHFWPRSSHPALRFDWSNLFASCGPSGERGKPVICGDHKGQWTPVSFVDPVDPLCEQRFAYNGNGTISPSELGGVQAHTMIERLNLSDDSLDYERFSIVAELEAQMKDGALGTANVAAEIAVWRALDEDGRLKSFGHVAARYLEDELL